VTPDFYDRALRRILRMTLALGILGALVALLWRGVNDASGFVIGSSFSLLNFTWWKGLASALGGPSGERPLRGNAVFLSARYLVAAALIYVIVRFLGITLAAVLAGLFVSVAAIILEILYELIFIRD
jgi:hypothetical protein